MSNGAPYDTRQKAVEVGCILKKELDIVTTIEQRNATEQDGRHLDVQGLINDNVQLFHENHKLLQANMELKNMLDSRIANIATRIQLLTNSVAEVNHTISTLR